MIVEIVVIGEIPRKLLDGLKQKLEKTFAPLVESCIVGVQLGMPPVAHNPSREQYDANIIFEHVLFRITSENKVLAITCVDLFTSSRDLNFIFGQARCPGRVALVSLYRLDPSFYKEPPNQKLFLERATKEAIHELGHTFGLGNCADQSCVMCFSNSIRDVD